MTPQSANRSRKEPSGELDLQALHLDRSHLVSRRTATFNQVHAFLIRLGITARKRLRAVTNSLEAILEKRKDDNLLGLA